jgi:hypothetical protein
VGVLFAEFSFQNRVAQISKKHRGFPRGVLTVFHTFPPEREAMIAQEHEGSVSGEAGILSSYWLHILVAAYTVAG